jgi:hypothetical protein
MKLFVASLVVAAFVGATSASAALVTYNVDLNFDPAVAGGGTGVGTVKGTVSMDTSTNSVTAVDLTESTNDGLNTIGGAFLSPTYSSFTFNQVGTFTTYFFGPQNNPYDTATLRGSSIALFFQSDKSIFDGQPIGPTITIEFAYPGGGSVQTGTFASITSEGRYLYGDVSPAGASAAPEPSTWAMLLMGFAGLGFAGHSALRKKAPAAT